jgi:NifB/MoaA-like Fe-S oxidoreductase
MAMNTESSLRARTLALPMADENSVVRRPKSERATVLSLDPESAAALAGIRIGDLLTHVNDAPVLDIVDFAFLSAGERVTLDVDRPDVGHVRFTIRKGYDEDLGIEFGDDLFDRVHICKNKCVFCFLYQQPKGLRPSLYIKDDDYRLSFLHGNYLTLTNMSEDEFARVIEQKLSPLFVSVHATDPELRGRMLGRKGPEPILPRLAALARARINIHAQVVLCPGYNDGEQLERTVRALAELHPAAPTMQGRAGRESDIARSTDFGPGDHNAAGRTTGGVLSVAIVPVGLTQFRDRLAALTTCDAGFCKALTEQAEIWRKQYRKTLGTNFVFLSDEFYLNADAPMPSARQYEGFPQLEDGVGLVRLFIDDARRVVRRLPKQVASRRTATMVTGKLARPFLSDLADALNQVENVEVNVCAVHNHFFEGSINVAGLLTGGDVVAALGAMGERVGERVLIPAIMLRDPDRDVFLDDMTIADFERAVGRKVCVVDRTPTAAAKAILAA